MLVYEYKLDGNQKQFSAIEEAIHVVQFIRNKCIRLWMDRDRVNKNDLQTCCAVLAYEYPFARRLNSQARQASADRAWFAISRFYENCREQKPGKKGYPTFQHNNRSVEYKATGWKLDDDGRHLTFTDGCGIGRLRLVGNKKQKIETFPVKDIKRVRIVRRADGYYAQFCVKAERKVEHVSNGKQLGIDVGLKSFLTDSEGNTVENPRHYRKAESKLKRLQRRLSRKQKKSANRKKARKAVASQHLKVQRQREDFARKQANALVSSCDLIAYENLQIKNMVRNRKLAKSIHDAGWDLFLQWVARYGLLHDIPVIAVTPHYTSQKCSICATIVKKSLSIRTHICHGCGVVLDRDQNAALNILQKALSPDQNGTEGALGNQRARLAKRFWTLNLYCFSPQKESGKLDGRRKNPRSFQAGSVSEGRIKAVRAADVILIPVEEVRNFKPNISGRPRTSIPLWRISYADNSLYQTSISAQIREGQQEAFKRRLEEIRDKKEHLSQGTMARYIVGSNKQPSLVEITLIWRSSVMPDEAIRQQALEAFQQALDDVLDWTTAHYDDGRVFMHA